MSISEQGRVMATGDGAQDGELDLGAVGRALARKKWWVLGPALAIAAASEAARASRDCPDTICMHDGSGSGVDLCALTTALTSSEERLGATTTTN